MALRAEGRVVSGGRANSGDARDLGTNSPACVVALLDVDDFVVSNIARGERWASEQIALLQEIIDQAGKAFEFDCTVTWQAPDEWVFVTHGVDEVALLEAVRALAERLRVATFEETSMTATVSIGRPRVGPHGEQESLEEAVAANQRKLILGGNRLLELEPESETTLPPPRRIEGALAERIRNRDCEGALQLLADWVEGCAEIEGVTPSQLRSWLAAEILFAINVVEQRRLSDGSLDWVGAFERTSFDEIMAMRSIHEKSYLRLWLEQLFGNIIENTIYPQRSGKPLLSLIDSYISEHYTEAISLNKVARALYISPFYISHLFHREMNTTFLKYVTALRIAKARDLLVETEAPIGIVAEQVGYTTAKTFRNVFKRAVGTTPSEYRRTRRRTQSGITE